MDEFITVLPRGNKKQKVVSYYYNLCKNCFVDVECVEQSINVEDVLPTCKCLVLVCPQVLYIVIDIFLICIYLFMF